MTLDKSSSTALAGLVVVDLSRVLGGPYCTQMLADHGADVIKIEPPQGDETRGWGPPFRAADGAASYFVGVNRNKRGMVLDLADAAGLEVLLRLLTRADVLVENFKPGTLERWGLDYDATLRERFPRLVHCRISGFGSDGPLGGLAGYDAAVQATSGVMSTNGSEDSGPTRVGLPIIDIATGMNACIGILLALAERARSGLGQFVDATLYDSGISLLHPHLANYLMSREPPRRTGNAHPNISPYDLFPTKTRPIFIAVGNDRQFARFCAEIGRPSLADDPRFLRNADRVANRPALRRELEVALAARDGGELSTALLAAGVPCGVVLEIPDLVAQPHAQHRRMIVDGESGSYGFANPVKLSRTPACYRLPPPVFGGATREILAELGYSEHEIDALERRKVVAAARDRNAGVDRT